MVVPLAALFQQPPAPLDLVVSPLFVNCPMALVTLMFVYEPVSVTLQYTETTFVDCALSVIADIVQQFGTDGGSLVTTVDVLNPQTSLAHSEEFTKETSKMVVIIVVNKITKCLFFIFSPPLGYTRYLYLNLFFVFSCFYLL